MNGSKKNSIRVSCRSVVRASIASVSATARANRDFGQSTELKGADFNTLRPQFKRFSMGGSRAASPFRDAGRPSIPSFETPRSLQPTRQILGSARRQEFQKLEIEVSLGLGEV